MRILILNWRDPKNPKSGGAEKLNLHVLDPFLARRDEVIWYAMTVKGIPKEETLNGIKIIRFGNILTHFLAWPFFFYTGKFGKVDFLIDSVHGIGYLSNLFAPFIKKRILVCEVARNIWDEMIPFPGNIIGKLLEPLMFHLYSQNKFWTISQSTEKDLEKMHIDKKNILILPMGFDAPDMKQKSIKTKNPTALFVGRVVEMKGIRDAILAIHEVNKSAQEKWTLQIIGRGDKAYEQYLKNMVAKLDLNDRVHFLGFVSEKEKFDMMAKSWILLVPSSREGWGMIVPESNYVGTPVIAYDSPGLRDSVQMYAKENKLIQSSYQMLAHDLKKMKRPQLIQTKPIPGWEALESTVVNDVVYAT